MKRSDMPILSRILLATTAVLLASCATSMKQGGGDGIVRLQAQRAANPKSEPVLRSLGIALYKAGQLDSARATLQQAAALDARDGVAQLYLGLTAEAQNDFPAARAAYSSYVHVGRTRRVRSELEQRLTLLARKELAASVKAAVAQETQLATTPGKPSTVAVLPFSFAGPDTSLKPLERGFAELLTTDLSHSAQLTVVDRSRTQALLDEIALQQSGATDSTSGVRAGRILQAGRLVRGFIQQNGQNLRADAALIETSTGAIGAGPSNDQPLDLLFTLEKNIALGVIDSMHVRLTTAERNAIEQRPTKSLAAFLSYSRGLAAEDAGKYDEANAFFQDAVRRDPTFAPAAQKGEETKTLMSASVISSSTIEAGLKGTSEGAAVTAAQQGSTLNTSSQSNTQASQTAETLNPSSANTASSGAPAASTAPGKDPQSGTGADNPSTPKAGVTLVIHLPKP